MPWWVRIRWWVERKKSKLPAWVLFTLVVLKEVYTGIPDLFDATKFWLETVKAMGGKVGLIATVVDSPWFSFALILVGIAWLRFVDKPRYVVRHPALPLLGGIFVGVIALAFWSVLVAGYVATRVSQQLQQKVEVLERTLERQASPWVLPDEQKRKLTEALNKVPSGVTYKLTIHAIPNCLQCSVYMTDLGETWVKIPGWQVQGGPNFTIDSRLIGVIVPVNMEDCPPEELQLVTSALDAAEIKYERGKPKGSLGFGCAVIVGSKPKE